MKHYTNIALPKELADRIDEIIKRDGWGYKTRGEFVKEAVRMLVIKLSENVNIKIKR
ncbi:ribbon-helix-helix protein, CopG family [Candidatus Woesearchaeota archaeon]|nr:ribbon-helix-helix protein, CopG family [Candidatus Woesearchaeota archaeon]